MPEPDSSPTSQAARRGGFWMFWTTLPGILTGVAALLTASVGLITALNRPGRERSVAASDKSVPAQSTTTSVPTVKSNSPPAGVFAQGRLAMKSPESADLEKGLVGRSVGGEDLYLHCSRVDACILNGMGSLLTVTEGPGDKASCIAALGSRRDGALHLEQSRAGQTVCIQTSDGHVGALEIVGLPGAGSIELTFSYTLFR